MSRVLRLRAAVVGSALLALALGGCPFPLSPSGGQPGEAKLVPFESAQDLLDYFQQQANNRYSRGYGIGFFDAAPLGAAAGAEQGDAAGSGSTNSGEFSTTNIQEAGVDESDVFKSDGTYFYMAREQALRIVRAVPTDEMTEVSRLDLGVWVDSLYLLDSTIIALGSQFGQYSPGQTETMMWPPYYGGSNTVIQQIDVSDPANPTVTGRVELDGSLASSRLTNGRLIVVLTVRPDLPADPTPLAIERMTLDEVMPKMRRTGAAAEEEDVVPWQRWLRPVSPDGYCMSVVATLDAANVENVLESVAVLANAGTIYASTEALYLTDAEYDPQDDYRERTAIHKFAFDENGAAQYTASGSVPGRLLNQFSLGEHEGYLRVATHVVGFGAFGEVGITMVEVGGGAVPDASPPAEGASGDDDDDDGDLLQSSDVEPPYNAVYVLGEVEQKLDIVGFVDGLAPGERIFSARFLGRRGFLVTFRRVDPLFVLDLSDAQNPVVVGELKIPGYSDYLHPLGETHLIGVGRTTVDSPWGEGGIADALQLSLFDVSDLSDPQLVEQVSAGGTGSSSDVSYTHKAFALVTRNEQTLLAVSVTLTPEGQTWWGDYTFSGVLCYQVEPEAGFTELGRLESVGSDLYYCRYWRALWRRPAFIGDTLYALTPDGVRAAPLNNFNETHAVTLTD